jgi:DNA-binding CsgD family transcriptional regulator
VPVTSRRLAVLTVLGGSDLEDTVYQELVATASATADELARSLQRQKGSVHSALAALTARGLITRTAARPPRYVAAPPDIVVESLLLRHQAELSEARAELARLVKVYRSGRQARSTDELVEIVVGAEPLGQRVNHLVRTARREFAGFVKPPFVAVDFDDAQPLGARDVHYRVIYDTEITTACPGFVGKLQAANTAPHVEYRLHPALPMKLMIADLETALLPLGRDSDIAPAAVIVHSSGLLDALVALYDHYWDASMPLCVGEASSGNSTASGDRRILSLLLGGATDEAIARQLGISLRTVRRRIHEMMHTAHAQNRAQLAWHAARKNWL